MGEDWQSIAAVFVVLATVAVFARRAWKRRRSRAGGGCASAGICGCAAAKPKVKAGPGRTTPGEAGRPGGGTGTASDRDGGGNED